MNKTRIKGAALGKLTGNNSMAINGRIDKAKGAVNTQVGKAKGFVRKIA